MKYMLMFCKSADDDQRFDAMSPQEVTRLFQSVTDWQASIKEVIVDPGYRLARSNLATTVRKRGGQTIVTDGPFVEGGEVVGGYVVVDVPDLDEAISIAKAFPACPTAEIRPVIETDQSC